MRQSHWGYIPLSKRAHLRSGEMCPMNCGPFNFRYNLHLICATYRRYAIEWNKEIRSFRISSKVASFNNVESTSRFLIQERFRRISGQVARRMCDTVTESEPFCCFVCSAHCADLNCRMPYGVWTTVHSTHCALHSVSFWTQPSSHRTPSERSAACYSPNSETNLICNLKLWKSNQSRTMWSLLA